MGMAANAIRRQKHPDSLVTFVVDRNINYTNVCTNRCRFCAFWRSEEAPDAYVISDEELYRKIDETLAVGGTQLLMQGGLHPKLGLDYALDLLRKIKKRYNIHIHSFSPAEIRHFAGQSGLSLRETVEKLHEAGLDSLPGGGAEILDNRVRNYISPRKITWEQWMEVMTVAHELGMKTTATMMFGSVETLEERVLHMLRVREVQDRTGGFTAFIPWSYVPMKTELGGEAATGMDYLKTLAVSRLMLDNIPNIQASWVTQGAKIAQLSLVFGANDFGGTMLEENVVRSAGAAINVPFDQIVHCIKEAGYEAAQRTTLYEIIRYY